jgi:hypothetical protein
MAYIDAYNPALVLLEARRSPIARGGGDEEDLDKLIEERVGE